MTEKKLVIDGLQLKYDGLFDLNKLLKEIDKRTSERGYTKAEKRRHEKVKPESKEFSIELRPSKIKTENDGLMIKIKMTITNLKEVEVLRDKVKTKLNKGNILMIFDAWKLSIHEKRWEHKPGFYFLRTLVDRFIYHFRDEFEDELVEDTHYIHKEIKAHLQLHLFIA